MIHRLTPSQADEILFVQFTIAWAGEAAGEPARLGWWKTDLVDKAGGGDLFARLVPKTAAWASLSLVRAAARAVDEAAREKLARGDAAWTLFHLGFAIDEQLTDRIVFHRQHQHEPREVFGERWLVSQPWSKGAFEALLDTYGKAKVEIAPAGRKVNAPRASAIEAIPLLAAALLPLSNSYPLPFIEVAS